MKTQDAKSLSLPDLLARLGHQPAYKNGSKLWYLSPLRNEITPSFCVVPGRQVAWIFSDYGTNVKGNILDFVTHYQHCSLKSALVWLEQIFGKEGSNNKITSSVSVTASTIQLYRIKSIQHPALLSYLKQRYIEKSLADRYLKELHYFNQGRRMFALGWKTDAGGWCLRAKNFKASLPPTGTTTIGSYNSCLAIFEGMFDFLAALSYFRTASPRGQVIVLNSVNHAHYALRKVEDNSYNCVKLFLDSDLAGRRAALQFMDLKNVQNCSKIFSPAKDFAAFYEHQSQENQSFSSLQYNFC